ncbi:MAG: hypothetical protein M1832_006006 [Thelocarpon impressellum]|nr:MAG: hypothetical protein M1832_006006 [Thelocarpon impressellum]
MSAPPPPKAKRALFKKPLWAKAVGTGDDSSDLFSRSKDVYADIVREQRAARERAVASARSTGEGEGRAREGEREGEGEEEVEGGAEEEGEGERERAGKRRRVSAEEEDHEEGLIREGENGGRAPAVEVNDGDARIHVSGPPPESSSRRDVEVHGTNTTATRPPVVELSDDEEDVPAKEVHDDEIIAVDPSANDDPPSDEELPELARKARERAKAEALDHPTPVTTAEAPSEAAPPDSTMNIFISSRLPATAPLLVRVKLSQQLKTVRLAWCHKQAFSAEVSDTVFLTWKGKRLFDLTPCKSLGGAGVDSTQGSDEDRRVALVATTDELFREERKLRERKYDEEEDDADTRDSPPPPSHPAIDTIRIVLRSKGFQDHRLKIRPTTKASQIVDSFRQARGVESTREVFLMFDGERLAPDAAVEQADIGDLDFVDVYVK